METEGGKAKGELKGFDVTIVEERCEDSDAEVNEVQVAKANRIRRLVRESLEDLSSQGRASPGRVSALSPSSISRDDDDEAVLVSGEFDKSNVSDREASSRSANRHAVHGTVTHPKCTQGIPFLSCEAARRHVALKLAAAAAEKALYQPMAAAPKTNPNDLVLNYRGGGFIIIRNGNRRPNRFRDLMLSLVTKLKIAIGQRCVDDFEAVQAICNARERRVPRARRRALGPGGRCLKVICKIVESLGVGIPRRDDLDDMSDLII